MKYRLVRLNEVNDSAAIEILCAGLGQNQVSQNVAQASAWHLANGLSWQELASKPRTISDYTGITYFFSHAEIESALKITSQAILIAEESTTIEPSSSSRNSPNHESYR
jgi:hypothetical protein